MKMIVLLVFAIGLPLSPNQGMAAPKKGITSKNLVARYESALKFLGTAVPIQNKKLDLEFTKREDGRKEFTAVNSMLWKLKGITFPSSDIVEDDIFWYTASK